MPPKSEDIWRTLLELYAEQEGIIITCTLVEKGQSSDDPNRQEIKIVAGKRE